MKGAVHGDATITERAPVKNDPTSPWELFLFSSFESDDPSEIFPSSITPTKKIKILNEETTVGIAIGNPIQLIHQNFLILIALRQYP